MSKRNYILNALVNKIEEVKKLLENLSQAIDWEENEFEKDGCEIRSDRIGRLIIRNIGLNKALHLLQNRLGYELQS
jgi:hypothetical protein